MHREQVSATIWSRRSLRHPQRGVILLAVLAVISAWTPLAGAEAAPPSLHVTGTGRAQAIPDLATLESGVTSEAAQAQAAVRSNSQAMKALLAALRKQGIDDKDVQTQQLHLTPVYAKSSTQRSNRISGYRASSRLRIRVREIGDAGTVLDALVAAGANDLGNISFTVREPAPLLDQARRAAVADARRKAALLAREAGLRLGPILEIRDGAPPSRFPTGRGAARMESGFAAASVPIARGELEFSAQVSLVYALREAD